MRRAARIAIALLSAAVTLALAGPAAAATFYGSVGPGMTISLKRANGNDVISMRAGTHTFVIRDRSSAHNFVLSKSGTVVRKTGVAFTGKRTWTVTIRRGTYRYYCGTHPSAMRGSFSAT